MIKCYRKVWKWKQSNQISGSSGSLERDYEKMAWASLNKREHMWRRVHQLECKMPMRCEWEKDKGNQSCRNGFGCWRFASASDNEWKVMNGN